MKLHIYIYMYMYMWYTCMYCMYNIYCNTYFIKINVLYCTTCTAGLRMSVIFTAKSFPSNLK